MSDAHEKKPWNKRLTVAPAPRPHLPLAASDS